MWLSHSDVMDPRAMRQSQRDLEDLSVSVLHPRLQKSKYMAGSVLPGAEIATHTSLSSYLLQCRRVSGAPLPKFECWPCHLQGCELGLVIDRSVPQFPHL